MNLKTNETIEDLQLNGLKIIQSSDGFKFGIDAVLIANFCRIKKRDIGVDLGTGTGIIPIILSAKSEALKIYGIEIQEEVSEMAKRSVMMNNLESRIDIINDDIKNKKKYFENSSMDFVVSNPPYFKINTIKSENIKKMISRHEVKCDLDGILETAAYILKPNKSFFMIHRPDRLVDLIEIARKYKLEPKEIKFVHPDIQKAPNLVMIKYVKSGNKGIKMLAPLYVYNLDGTYTKDINEIYKSKVLGGF